MRRDFSPPARLLRCGGRYSHESSDFVAQKLHAASAPRSHRVHDLIDLQLIMGRHNPDWAELRGVCRRLFAYRRQQQWPPVVESGPDWDSLYSERVGSLPVLPTAAEAVAWANALIARIDMAR